MGGIITTIRDAGAGHPLAPIVDDLDELNVYCKRYHHERKPERRDGTRGRRRVEGLRGPHGDARRLPYVLRQKPKCA